MDFFDTVINEEEMNQDIYIPDIKQAFFYTYRMNQELNLSLLEEVTKASKEEIINELMPILIYDPIMNRYVLLSEYLQGNKFQLYQELVAANQKEEANKIAYYLQQYKTIEQHEAKLMKLNFRYATNEQLKEIIGYLPVQYVIHDFLSVQLKEYETDYYHLLLNPISIEVTENIEVMHEFVRLYHRYFPENKIYLTTSKNYYNQLKKYYKDDSYIECMNEATWSRYTKEDQQGLFLVFDYGHIKAQQKVLDATKNGNHIVLFMNYLVINKEDLVDYFTPLRGTGFTIEALAYLKNRIFDHSKLKEVHAQIIECGHTNQILKFEELIKTMKYMGLHSVEKEHLKMQLALIGTQFTTDSKVYLACKKIIEIYYEVKNSKQLVYLDSLENKFGVNYIDLIKQVLLIDDSDIQIIEGRKIEPNKRIYIAKTESVYKNEIPGITNVISIDFAPDMEVFLKRMNVEDSIMFLTKFSIDSLYYEDLKAQFLTNYLITRNEVYLQLAQFDALQVINKKYKIDIKELLKGSAE